MILKCLIVLCLGFSSTFSARIPSGEQHSDEITTPSSPEKTNDSIPLSKKIKIVNSVLLKYDRELDRKVPFKEIQEAIRGLDVMARNYTGASIDDITRASHVGYLATRNYFRATDAIINWCARAETVFEYILENHSELDQDRIEKSVRKSLNNGLKAMRNSIKLLKTVVDQLSEMERVLRPVPDNLNKELKEISLEHDHAVKGLRRKKLISHTALTAVGMLVSFILSFYLGPIGGGIIGLSIKMMLTAIPTAVIEGRKIPSMEEKLKIVEAYYVSVMQTVEYAKENVTNVRDTLEKKLYFEDTDLGADVEVNVNADAKKINKSESTLIVEALREFMPSLREMLSRHLPALTRTRRTAMPHHQTPLGVERFVKSTAKTHEAQLWKEHLHW